MIMEVCFCTSCNACNSSESDSSVDSQSLVEWLFVSLAWFSTNCSLIDFTIHQLIGPPICKFSPNEYLKMWFLSGRRFAEVTVCGVNVEEERGRNALYSLLW